MTSSEASPSPPRSELASTTLSSLVLLVALLILFGPSLFRGETFQIRDHSDYFTPLRHYTASRLLTGDLPLWNPFSGSGEGWLANPQTGVFYPPALLFLFLPFAVAYQLFLALHLFILGISMDRWLRLRLSGGAALFGALSLMLGGSTLATLDVQNNLSSFAWFPLMLLHAERVRSRGSIRDHALLALSMTLTFLGAEPMLTLFGGAVALLIAFASRKTSLLRAGFTVVLTVLLSAAQLFPFLELLARSDRLSGISEAEAFLHSMSPRDWLGVAVSSASPFGSYELLDTAQQYLTSIYAGGVVLALALLAVLSFRRMSDALRVMTRRMSIVAGVGLLLSLGSSFGLSQLFLLLHLDVGRYPSRFFIFASFGIVTIAACGFELVAASSRRLRAVVAVSVLVLAAVGAMSLAGGELQAIRTQISLLSAAVGCIALFQWQLFTRRTAFFLLLLTAVGADLISSARQSLASALPNLHGAEYSRDIGWKSKVDRILVVDEKGFNRTEWFSGYLPLLSRTHDADSPSPLMTSKYVRVREASDSRLAAAGVDQLIVARGVRVSGFELEKAGRATDLLQNLELQQTLLHLSPSWKVVRSDAEAVAELPGAGQPAVTGASQSSNGSSRSARVRILLQEEDRQRFAVETDIESLLWVTQNDSPQWEVFVDGVRATPVKVFGTFRGVIVPRGTHEVEWKHSSKLVLISSFFSLFGICIFLFATVRGR